MRMKCPVCGEESVSAFSCKFRGFCSSCGAKRSAETAAHLIDNVLPMTRYRQVVITLPFALRFWCATNRALFSKVHQTIKEALQRKLKSKAEETGIKKPATGFITFVHNWNSALALSPHFHILVMDAAFDKAHHQDPIPRRLGEWKSIDLKEIIHEIVVKIVKHLQKKGYLNEHEEAASNPPLDELFADHEDLANALGSSLHNRRPIGKGATGSVTKIGKGFGYWEEDPVKKGRLCLSQNGFTIHASRVIKTLNRRGLEDLISYMARPAISTERLTQMDNGNIRYSLKKQWQDGTTAAEFTPMEFLSRLAALVPPPFMNMIKYAGIFSPNHPMRSKVLPNPDARKGLKAKCPHTDVEETERKKVKNTSWARLLARIFQADVGSCKKCGADMEIISAIFDRTEVSRYLKHVGLARPPPVFLVPPSETELTYHPLD